MNSPSSPCQVMLTVFPSSSNHFTPAADLPYSSDLLQPDDSSSSSPDQLLPVDGLRNSSDLPIPDTHRIEPPESDSFCSCHTFWSLEDTEEEYEKPGNQ